MNQSANLIPVFTATIGEASVQTVNARELHQFLEVGKDFSNWIKDRIQKYEFVENQDFVCSQFILTNNGRGGRNRIDYSISIDMAKILAATERNDKGRYFLNHTLKNAVLNPEELLNMLGDVDIPEADDLYIYAIRECETGRLKIGISKNPHTRLRQLQTGNPNKLEIAAIREAPNRFADERAFHREASHYKIRGEWFSSNAIGVMQ